MLLFALPANAAADEPVTRPALSSACKAPDAEIASPEPLPRVAVALEQRKQLRVLAIGSSSTVGIGSTAPSRTYPAQLESILETAMKGIDVTIVNRGVSGEVASGTAERIRVLAAMERPDLVLWQVGTNDALARVPIDQFEETLRDTIRWLREHDIDVVLVGLQYTPRLAKDDAYMAVRATLTRVAQQEHVLHIRRYNAMEFISRTQEKIQLVGEDNLHLNDLGYHCMAEHVATAIIASLFLRDAKAPKRP